MLHQYEEHQFRKWIVLQRSGKRVRDIKNTARISTYGTLVERRTVSAVSQEGGPFVEFGKTGDRQVLFVGLGGSQDFLCLLHKA
jgi:hypothetical protein